MQLYDQNNWDRFLDIIPVIKSELTEWRLIHYKISAIGDDNIDDIAAKLCEMTGEWPGAAFVYNETEILMLAKTGHDFEQEKFKDNIEEFLTQYKCKISVKNVTFEGIAKVEVILKRKVTLFNMAKKKSLIQKRAERKNNKILIVEDDAMIRKMVARTLAKQSDIIEMAKGEYVVEKYLLELPDAVFLDVNLPHHSGIEILKKIMHVDPDAYVVMISGEETAEIIEQSLSIGARYFIPKPFTPEKIMQSLAECKTLS